MRFSLLAALFALLTLLSPAAAETPPARLVTGLSSSDDLIRDLEYLVVKLANREESWKDNVLINIEIFLEGVDPAKTVRFDSLFDEANGYRREVI
ncbi:MAG: hypothetical protein KDA90_24260, partial [Planctomycetaceae bacterium]|nr:hypothetical protein [Planctomycetaceae bacterium]